MSSLLNVIRRSGSFLAGLSVNVEMNAPRDTATTPHEKDTNRSGQDLQQPPAGPYNGPKDESPFVTDGESEHRSEHDGEDEDVDGENEDVDGEDEDVDDEDEDVDGEDEDVDDEDEDEDDEEEDVDSENEGEWPCICGDGLNTDGMWIRCDKSNCPFTWYHIACVGLEEAPAGKWYCSQCRARTREISKAKLGPKKKGTAVKAPQKKEQVHWKGWKELPSDEEEQFKQNVESLWAAQIIPGKTRRGPRQDAPCSEDETESTGNGQSPSQQLEMDILRQQSTGKRVPLGPLRNEDSELSLQSGSSNDDQTAWMSELIVDPQDMTIDDRAASPGEAESESSDWETVMDVDDKAASPGEDESKSTDRDTIMEVNDIASFIIKTALGTDHVSDDPRGRSS